jgi:hypothetical protein
MRMRPSPLCARPSNKNLALAVPGDGSGRWLDVSGAGRNWKKVNVPFFDNTYPHRVSDGSTGVRMVLYRLREPPACSING